MKKTRKLEKGARVGLERRAEAPSDHLQLLPIRKGRPGSLDEASADIEVLRHNLRVAQYLVGDRLAWVRDNKAFAPRYPTMTAFLRSFKGVSERTLFRALALADSVPAQIVVAHDAAKIEAGIRLLPKNARGEVFITKRALEAIKIDTIRDGQTHKATFAEATPEELNDVADLRRRNALPKVSKTTERGVERVRSHLGSGVTAVASIRLQRQGLLHVAVITVAADRLEEFEKLLK